MKIPLCIPLCPQSKQEYEALLAQALAFTDCVELYPDFLTDYEPALLANFARSVRCGIITLRRPQFSPTTFAHDQREAILREAVKNNLMCDIDIRSERDILSVASAEGVRRIHSYHNYDATPSLPELEALIDELQSGDPEMIKLATWCRDSFDQLRLLHCVSRLKESSCRFIVSPMGIGTEFTRITAVLWGSAYLYCALEGGAETASGQFSATQARTLESFFS